MKLKEKDYAKLIVEGAKQESNTRALAQELWHSMYQNKALSKLERIFTLSKEIEADRNGALIVKISSAIELLSDQKRDIELELRRRYKKDIYAEYEIDALLGTGLKIIAGDKLIDLSSKNQIERLNNHLKDNG